ncbi:MAG: sigma-54 dependent transcriptional regulator [Deltaproteobacteria bacterium]|nr:sigma-54 dependent transcriptional regulator [Deltaproteobacteria bacterium]
MSLVLVVDDERGVREGLVRAMKSAGHQTLSADSVKSARELVIAEHQQMDCVLLDVRLGDGDGLALLREIKQTLAPSLSVIIATAYGDSERTIGAMRDGAFDYVTKPFDLDTLFDAVSRAIRQRELTRERVDTPSPTPAPKGTLIGSSAAMLAVWKAIGRAAASDAPVLITGETGTGKELVARAIHQFGARSTSPFVAVNLAALTETLLESELFGYEKGAFTGANARKVGRLELVGNGTLFLDEIGDLDLTLQTRLLRVLGERRFERVGGSGTTLTFEGRVLAATHKAVRPGENKSTLREDLYYRLAVIEIEIPPLRARKSDIPLLVASALGPSAAHAVSESAMEALLAYAWPGNVRELLHVIERAAAMCGGEVIDREDLPPSVLAAKPIEENHGYSLADFDGLSLKDALAKLERALIVQALERAAGNRSEAARTLGMARPQLYTRLDEYGLNKRE